MHHQRRAATGALALLVAATILGACSSASDDAGDTGAAEVAASCAAPELTVSRSTVEAGQTVEIVGTAFLHGCADAGAVVDGTAVSLETTAPMTTLEVIWIQAGRRTVLASVDADATGGGFRLAVTVPADAVAGPAALRVSPAEDVAIAVTATP
jgi:hypothetical protein